MGTHLLELVMNVIQFIVATVLVFISIHLIQMDFQWNVEMGGIHPMIAFPVAALSSIWALILLFTEDDERDWEN